MDERPEARVARKGFEMAQYLVLIYEDQRGYAEAGQQVWDEVSQEHRDFMASAGSELLGGNALEPVTTATSIRTSMSGEVTVTDGPFAETKEALGGYYLIEAADLDAAIAVAKQVPARFGGVEVRPVMVFE
jgi:hypothetical protein